MAQDNKPPSKKTKSGVAWYRSGADDFVSEILEKSTGTLSGERIRPIVDMLITAQARAGFEPSGNQIEAWSEEVEIVAEALYEVSAVRPIHEWSVLFEYPIPRRQTRPDVILLAEGVVIVLEFKVGAEVFHAADRNQAIDYALDLKDFHEATRGLVVVPVLVATKAGDKRTVSHSEGIHLTNPQQLALTIDEVVELHGTDEPIDLEIWDGSRYYPTPDILEAAVSIYAGNDIRELNHARAENLTSTVDAIRRIVARARAKHERIICFVTGVPGSGKTLTGLSSIHNVAASGEDGTIGTYLSGNGPLVQVLQYALAKDIQGRSGVSLTHAQRESSVMIQMVHKFIAELGASDTEPPENVIVFDEAQRSWDERQMTNKQNIEASEAAVALDVMARAPDWSVIVALVGEGQEINTGEGGISEWVLALQERPDWVAVTANPARIGLGKAKRDPALHLSVGTRAPRADNVAAWIDAVLEGDSQAAKRLIPKRFPIVLTRDLEEMRAYLRDHASIDRRTGLLASAQARRLRAFGIEMNGAFQGDVNWPKWFVEGPEDLRSSYALEVAASEFKCQGLELDWAGLCWGNDMLWDGEFWTTRRMRGPRWTVDSKVEFALNRYRVLLSRARYGMAIWIPDPLPHMQHMDCDGLHKTAQYLADCGVPDLSACW